ncbi:MAG: hypothetical protein ABR540_16450 [Acidimicrobiales bacterium]
MDAVESARLSDLGHHLAREVNAGVTVDFKRLNEFRRDGELGGSRQ